MNSPLVKMLCHRGPLTDLAVERGGWAMVTVGMDARMKIWDIRSTYRHVKCYFPSPILICNLWLQWYTSDFVAVIFKYLPGIVVGCGKGCGHGRSLKRYIIVVETGSTKINFCR